MLKNIVIALSVLLVLFFSSPVFSQSNKIIPIKPTIQNCANEQMLERMAEKISNERIIYEKSLDRYSQQTNQLLERHYQSFDLITKIAMAIITVMFLAGLYILKFFIGKNAKDIESRISLEYEQKYNEIFNNRWEETDKYINLKTGKIDQLEKTLHGLKGEYSQLIKYKNRRFTYFSLDGDATFQSEKEVLHSFGIADIHITRTIDELNENIQSIDVLLFNFDGSVKSLSTLKNTIKIIQNIDKKVFLIVYTYNNGSPVKLEMEIVKLLYEYKWFQLANYPMTLVSIAKTLLK